MAAAVKARVAVVRELMLKLKDKPRHEAMSALQAAALKEELSSARCKLHGAVRKLGNIGCCCWCLCFDNAFVVNICVDFFGSTKETNTYMYVNNKCIVKAQTQTAATVRYSSQPV